MAVSGLCALLAFLLWPIAALRPRPLPRTIAAFTWLGSALMALLGIMGAALMTDFQLLALTLPFGLCVLMISTLQIILEVRLSSTGRPLAGLGAAVGFLIAVGSLIIPAIPGQLGPIALPTLTPIPALTLSRVPTHTPRFSVTPSPILSPTPTTSPLPTLTYTPTVSPIPAPATALIPFTPLGGTAIPGARIPIITETQTACTITVVKAVNIRANPDPASTLLGSLPIGSVVSGTARTTDWWRVRFRERDGWLIAGAVTVSAACNTVPTVTP